MSEEVSASKVKPVLFDFREIVTAMLRERNIHEGVWGLFVEFGLTAANMGFNSPEDGNLPHHAPEEGPPDLLLPSAIIPIKQIGLLPHPVISNIAVDAAVVNPKGKRPKVARKPPKKK